MLQPQWKGNRAMSKGQNLKDQSSMLGSMIAEAKIKPRMHPSFLLGTFTAENPPTGFSISIHPNPKPADSVTTRVARTGSDNQYKLILHIANNSEKTVGVEVRYLKHQA
jgi:hypothetical protein